jgi:outer membrane immunogenic protein
LQARKLVFCGGALVSLLAAFSASAADLPARKAPLPEVSAPPALWTGFYAGLNAGYGWSSNSANTASAPLFDGLALAANNLDPARQLGAGLVPGVTALANSGAASLDQSGFIGGGQIGYNYQWGSNVVVGLEADIQGTTLRANGRYAGVSQDNTAWQDPRVPGLMPCSLNGCTLTRVGLGGGQIAASTDWLGTARGRIGYLATPNWLIYATGGLAYGGVHASAAHSALTIGTLAGANDAALPVPFPYSQFNGTYFLPSLPGAANYSGTRAGWTVGGGVEWLFAPSWSLKLEGLYYNLGSADLRSSPVSLLSPLTINLAAVNVAAGQLLVANAPVTRITFDGALVRAGINYHFNIW